MSKTPPARLVETAGAAAVATTRADISWSVGAADGMLARDGAVDLIARIVDAVRVPVTAPGAPSVAQLADRSPADGH